MYLHGREGEGGFQLFLSSILIAVISVFMFAFAMGPGPLSYFLTAEMVSQQARSAAQSWTSLTRELCRGVLLAIFLPMKNTLGQAITYALLFVVPLIFAWGLFYLQLPETKNRNLKELEEEQRKLDAKVKRILGRKPTSTAV